MSNNGTDLLGMKKNGLLFILSGPAGTGKTTLIRKLQQEFSRVKQSVSFVSRQPRPNEVDGLDYHFISREAFEKKAASGDFLEYVSLYNDYYGTDQKRVEKEVLEGKFVFLVIDTQGALKLKGKMDAVFIFVRPPSMDDLEKRIRNRRTEPPEKIQKRLDWAKRELDYAAEYDYLVINDELEMAYQVLRSIVIAQAHKQPFVR